MKLEVPMQAIKASRYCQKWYICLSGNQDYFCRSVPSEDHSLLIEPNPLARCHYKLETDQGNTCTCPLRQEIYQTYGI